MGKVLPDCWIQGQQIKKEKTARRGEVNKPE